MNFKEKLTYTALGGILVVIGMILASFLTDLSVAQNEQNDMSIMDDMSIMEFDEIKCRRLSIVDNRGKTHAVLQKNFERMSDTADVIQIYNDDRRIVYSVGFDRQGNGVWKVNNRHGKRVIMSGVESDSGNGFLEVQGTNGGVAAVTAGRPWWSNSSIPAGGRRSEGYLGTPAKWRRHAGRGHKWWPGASLRR